MVEWASLRVIVVDDNVFFRQLVRTVLSAVGVTDILEASDADEALAALSTTGRQTDLVLLDYVMGPVDGLTLTRMIRNERTSPHPMVPIIMVSGHIKPADVQTALNAGVNAVVGKPISARDLLRSIKRILTDPVVFLRTDHYFGPDHTRRSGLQPAAGAPPAIIDVREH